MSKYFFSLPNITAGFVAVLVGFSSSAVLVFQAASSAGASAAEISSWLFALGISLAVTCIGFSRYYRAPILMGWSTPGAALLATSLTGFSMGEAVGAFMFAALLTIIAGVTGLFERVMVHIPKSITSAMLAGILIRFGMNIFVSMEDSFSLVFTMVISYFIGKRFFPRYVIIFVLMMGILTASMQGLFDLSHITFSLSMPIFTKPVFSWSALFSIGIPLFIVNMTSQNIPGIAILNSSGYEPPISPIISWMGVATLLCAPFGCFSIGLAALSAAICTGTEADDNATTRYKSTIFAGLCWLGVGVFGATIVALFFVFPHQLVVAVAGLAICSTIGSSLRSALEEENNRESAIITLLVSASGISLFGNSAAFCGLIAGSVCSFFLNFRKQALREPFIQPLQQMEPQPISIESNQE